MTLIKSISGTRGTIGGRAGSNLTAQDAVECTAAFGQWVLQNTQNPLVVIGRDARISGEVLSQIVCSTLRMMGIDVLDLGLSTTPTLEIAVVLEGAGGGIVLTASHNPAEWNALKFLNHEGEFLSGADGAELLRLSQAQEVVYAPVHELGSYRRSVSYLAKHRELILSLPLVRADLISKRRFKVVVDCINSTAAISILPLLEHLGCEVVPINNEMHGRFAHNPEPLPEHLSQLSQTVRELKADLGIALDPDVDRIAFVCEDGEAFGEEYSLVAIADYVLGHEQGHTVSNLSSTRALAELAEKHHRQYHAAAVGEVHVVHKMKQVGAVIGGEGNGGIIYPRLHYGRDALVGAALFLSFLAESELTCSELRDCYPRYTIIKDKLELSPQVDIAQRLERLEANYAHCPQNKEDGLKIFFDRDWVHLRRSNTEPIIRIYAESDSTDKAQALVEQIKAQFAL